MPKQWSIDDVWTDVFEKMVDDPILPRTYLYASELGSSYVDVFLKMKATPYSNLPTVSARQKMEAGKVAEMVLLYVLKRAGIMKAFQKKIDFQLPGLLSVHGKLDFLAGGTVDLKEAEDFTRLTKILFEELSMPAVYHKIALRVIRKLQMLKEGDEELVDLSLYVFDAKSTSDYVFRMVEKEDKARPYHVPQIFHYLYGLTNFYGIPVELGKVAYINRDDGRLLEKSIYNNSENLENYVRWVTQMTEYVDGGTQPPLEPVMSFNKDVCRFDKNTVGVEWSRYLTLLYGFESPETFRAYIDPIIKDLNYVYRRCVSGAKLTAGNLESIVKAKKHFTNFDDLVSQGKLKGVLDSEGSAAKETTE